MTVAEKKALLRYHGECLSGAFDGARLPHRSDVIEHAERALALAKSISKFEYAIEE